LSHQELTQRLMEDAPANDSAPETKPVPRVRWLIALMALLLPLAAFGVYFFVGTPVALDPALIAQANGDEQMTPQKLEAMAVQLSQRLEKEPQNAEGWVMLGRIQRALARYDQADAALQKALALERNDDILIERAEVLAQKKTRAVSKANHGPSSTGCSKPIRKTAMPCCLLAVQRFLRVVSKTHWPIGKKYVVCCLRLRLIYPHSQRRLTKHVSIWACRRLRLYPPPTPRQAQVSWPNLHPTAPSV